MSVRNVHTAHVQLYFYGNSNKQKPQIDVAKQKSIDTASATILTNKHFKMNPLKLFLCFFFSFALIDVSSSSIQSQLNRYGERV